MQVLVLPSFGSMNGQGFKNSKSQTGKGKGKKIP
jgi:hypothetical protein